jgi:hypothetical protein
VEFNNSTYFCKMNRLFAKTSFIALILIISQVSVGKDVNSIAPYLGNYKVTFTGTVGGPHEPSGSIVSGTTAGIITFSLEGNITLSESEPGVIAVPKGTSIPGIKPEDIIYGAAVMQNPLRIFIGTEEASRPGDFGLYSSMKFGLPDDPSQLFYSGCYGEGPFNCVPMFFRRHSYSGKSVNLVYFTISASGNNDSVIISGTLYDRHLSEAAAANIFNVPVESPILGNYNDNFAFSQQTQFKLVIKGNEIMGWIKGTGSSVAGMVSQQAIFEVEIGGTKE